MMGDDEQPADEQVAEENDSLLDALSELPVDPSLESLESLPDTEPEELAAAFEDLAPLGDPDSLENPDPALAVEEMLASEVMPENPPLEELLPTLTGEALPSFQLELEILPKQRESLKNLAQSLAVDLPEGGAPLLSQLTEFQAVALRQGALALGAKVKASVHFPLPSLSEEEQALGDLARIPDSTAISEEGAPSVALPKNEREVMVLTELGANLVLNQTLGVVTSHRSIARRFFREEEAEEKLRKEIARIPGRANNLPGSRLEALFRELILDLQKAVLRQGGNALFGLRLESFSETSHLDPELEQMRLVAFGTAAIVEKPGQA